MRINYLSESAHNEWYTPPHLVAACREVLGGKIDFDPFSCAYANTIVNASTYYTKQDDALLQDWPAGAMFANPPYERGLIAKCIERIILHRIDTGSSMCVLVNVATDAKWFQLMMHRCTAVCFFHKRVAFIDSNGNPVKGNTRAQCVFYFGISSKRFATIMQPHGYTMKRV